MDKIAVIAKIALASGRGLLPPGLQPLSNLVQHGLDEIGAQIEKERQRQGLTWQELEAQLGAEMQSEKDAWDKLVTRLEAGDQP